MIEKSLIIGSGNWGTTVAKILAESGRDVTLWSRNQKHLEDIQTDRINHKSLPGITLPSTIKLKNDFHKWNTFDLLILAIPVNTIRDFISHLPFELESRQTILCLSKGIELDTGKRVSQILQEVLPRPSKIAVLSGPNIANEIAVGKPAMSTISSRDIRVSKFTQNYCTTSNFRVYTNPDLIGVEICGALKNIIAIGAGICHQLRLGDNAVAALVTRGIAEIARFGQRFGANPVTFMGMAGVGDLSVTCMSQHSRNNRMGRLLAQGFSYEEAKNEMTMVSEGVSTCQIVYKLAAEHQIYMPITTAIYKVVFENMAPAEAITLLMKSDLKDELY